MKYLQMYSQKFSHVHLDREKLATQSYLVSDPVQPMVSPEHWRLGFPEIVIAAKYMYGQLAAAALLKISRGKTMEHRAELCKTSARKVSKSWV